MVTPDKREIRQQQPTELTPTEQEMFWLRARNSGEYRDRVDAQARETRRLQFANTLLPKLVAQEAGGDEGWIQTIAKHQTKGNK